MAASYSIYPVSYKTLQAPSRAAQTSSSGSLTLTLPQPPSNSETDPKAYIDGAINFLAESETFFHHTYHYLDHRLDTLGGRVNDLEKKADRIEGKIDDNFKYIQKQFTTNKNNVKAFKG